jgi:hypothetical protein
MAASSSALPVPATSTTSSGFADGLGRRVLAFDREEGVMLERLVLRPELAAFEGILRDRVERLGGLEDERLARPRTVEREAGGLAVVSEFVPGSRLSDLLETSAGLGHAPGVDAALGFLLDVLPALCGLHAGVGFAHGTITPSRTVLTPAGQIVLLDGIYGDALSYLRYSRRKLWLEFGIATASGPSRLDQRADIAQAALAGVMLIFGRPLRNDEYLSGLSGVLREVVDVAQIRSTTSFAIGVEEFLERALPVASSRPYTSADDALFDVRQLANELGAQGCRRALVDFIEQMESPAPAVPEPEYDDLAAKIEAYGSSAQDNRPSAQETEPDLIGGVEAEIDLDVLVENRPHDMTAGAIEIDQSTSLDDEAVDWVQLAAASAGRPGAEPPVFEPLKVEPGIVEPPVLAHRIEPPIAEEKILESPFVHESPILPERVQPQALQESASLQVPAVEPAPSQSGPAAERAEVAPAPSAALDITSAAEPSELATEEPASTDEPNTPEGSRLRWRRAKRATRSVRARKDKLRSVSESDAPAIVPAKPPAPPPAPPPPPPPPPAPEAKKPVSGNWLVAPERAAAFEEMVPVTPTFAAPEPKLPPPVPVHSATPPIPLMAPPPPVPLYVPPPAAPAPVPVESVFSRTVGSIAPSYEAPPAWTPPPPSPPQVRATPAPAPVTPQLTTVRLKDPPRPRAPRAPDPAIDIYSSPSAPPPSSEPTAFPWKLAAAVGVIMVVAIIGGKVYMPAKSVAPDDEAASQAVSSPAPAPSAGAAARPIAGSVVANTGRLEIETQPAGARILLDGKPAGESPVALDGIAAGRHTVTFVTSSGSVKRAVRIEAGRITKLDVPIFSGWVGIYAPFVLDVVEGGHVIGTTEEPRILLSPGKHDLTLVNRELGYSSAQTVEIEPGEVKSISIDPRGHVNLNASPWAEVWIDGRKVGDTPIANLQLPLGVREVTFRHPQFGERRVTVTVKGNAAAAISIDMSKP